MNPQHPTWKDSAPPVELFPHIWCPVTDSNRRPLACRANALPAELTGRMRQKAQPPLSSEVSPVLGVMVLRQFTFNPNLTWSKALGVASFRPSSDFLNLINHRCQTRRFHFRLSMSCGWAWLRGQESNLRPPAYGAGELPLLYPAVYNWRCHPSRQSLRRSALRHQYG